MAKMKKKPMKKQGAMMSKEMPMMTEAEHRKMMASEKPKAKKRKRR